LRIPPLGHPWPQNYDPTGRWWLSALSAQAGRILPFSSVLVPFWLVWAFAGFAGMIEVWPAVLVAGVFFAIPQFLMSNFHGPWLVDVVAAVVSLTALVGFLLKWRPKRIWGFEHEGERAARGTHGLPAVWLEFRGSLAQHNESVSLVTVWFGDPEMERRLACRRTTVCLGQGYCLGLDSHGQDCNHGHDNYAKATQTGPRI
jgi:L-lactate permease